MMVFDKISIFADLKDIEGKKPSEISNLKRDEYIVLMRAAGYTIKAIAERTGISRVTTINTLKDYAEEVKRLQLAEFEEVGHAGGAFQQAGMIVKRCLPRDFHPGPQ